MHALLRHRDAVSNALQERSDFSSTYRETLEIYCQKATVDFKFTNLNEHLQNSGLFVSVRIPVLTAPT